MVRLKGKALERLLGYTRKYPNDIEIVLQKYRVIYLIVRKQGRGGFKQTPCNMLHRVSTPKRLCNLFVYELTSANFQEISLL